MIQTKTIIEIPFHDVDLMRVVWHGHYAKYFEIARCELLESIDYNVPQMEASGYAWPVIDMRVRYAQPIVFQQKIEVTATLVEWENRMKVEYLIRDLATGQRLTKGYTIQVAVSFPDLEMQYVSPDVLFHQLGLEP